MNALELSPFRSAVWNLFGGTSNEQSKPALEATRKWGTSLWIACEARGKDRDQLFESFGLETVAYDQVRVAWDPERWRLEDELGTEISETFYSGKHGKNKIFSLGQFATLTDLRSGDLGLTLDVGSYHTPAGVQSPEDKRPQRRYDAFIESLLYMAARAKDTDADGVLYGGDDNWDEDGPRDKGDGIQTEHTEPIMLGKATGLRQIQAGQPTFGRREIDDYRIRFLDQGGHVAPVDGVVKVIDGRGAETPRHQIHMREWRWSGIKQPVPEPTQHPCPDCGKLHIGRVKV